MTTSLFAMHSSMGDRVEGMERMEGVEEAEGGEEEEATGRTLRSASSLPSHPSIVCSPRSLSTGRGAAHTAIMPWNSMSESKKEGEGGGRRREDRCCF